MARILVIDDHPDVRTFVRLATPHLDRPFAFFGHSMGALVAFELTRHLRRTAGPLPVHLFVSARTAPKLPDRTPPAHHLPDEEFIARLRSLNGTPEEVWRHAELRALPLPSLRADFAVFLRGAQRELLAALTEALQR